MNTLKKIATPILKRIVIILAASAIGLFLLYGVFCIPVAKMMPHAKSSAVTLYNEGLYPTKFGSSTRCTLDNFTDALMIQNAIHPSSGRTLEDVLLANHMSYSNVMLPVDDLITETSTPLPKEGTPSEYMRYWHGYLLFLKPLLLVMDYSGIRILNLILQTGLFILLLFLIRRRRLVNFLIPFLASWLAISPWILPFSMQLSTVYYIALAGTDIMLLLWDKIKNNIYIYFLILGLLTSYFDYLTWPLITLGLPLIFYLLMEQLDLKKSLRTTCIDTGLLCINWGIGYGCMWAMKWVITELVLHNGALTQAFGAAVYRSSSESDVPGSWISTSMVWKQNVLCTFYPLFLLVLATCILFLTVRLFKRNSRQIQVNLQLHCVLPFLFIAVLPFLWYAVLKNHSYVHPSLTFRSLWLSYLSVLCLIVSLKKSGN